MGTCSIYLFGVPKELVAVLIFALAVVLVALKGWLKERLKR